MTHDLRMCLLCSLYETTVRLILDDLDRGVSHCNTHLGFIVLTSSTCCDNPHSFRFSAAHTGYCRPRFLVTYMSLQ